MLQGMTVIGVTVTDQYALNVLRVKTREGNADVVWSIAPLTAVIIYKSPERPTLFAWIVLRGTSLHLGIEIQRAEKGSVPFFTPSHSLTLSLDMKRGHKSRHEKLKQIQQCKDNA